jgi:[acyl-carrier-protein] S-malonyltransferase
MEEASNALDALLRDIPFAEPAFPIVGNVSGQVITTADGIRDDLRHHMERPVQWTTSVQTMLGAGFDTFVEVGNGAVLGGLIKRIDRTATNITTADLLA